MSAVRPGNTKVIARGLSSFEIRRLRYRLRQSACSEAWVDDQIITTQQMDAEGELIAQTHFNSKIFPPGGRHDTRMKWCRACGRWTPRPAVHLVEHRTQRSGPVVSVTLQCDDCRIGDDEEMHRELYQAGLHLRPTGSLSFVSRRALHNDRKRQN